MIPQNKDLPDRYQEQESTYAGEDCAICGHELHTNDGIFLDDRNRKICVDCHEDMQIQGC
jgi:predicted CXXCH cytochrome family protein